MFKTLYFIIILILFSSCNRPTHNTHNISDIVVSDTLYGKETTVPIDMLMPAKIVTLDANLIIFDPSGDDLFHVFDSFSLRYKYSFGKVGGGPSEFTSIDPNTIKALNGNLIFLDNNKVIRMRVDSKKAERINSYFVQVGSNPLNRLQMINDSIYIADLMEGESEHSMININSGAEFKKFGIYPSSELKFDNGINRYQAFIKASASNPINSKFAVFYLYHNKMRIYDDGNLETETNVEHSYDKYIPDKKSNNLIFRSEPVATADYIYTLNIEKIKKDIDFSNFYPKIEVWNWEGNLIAKYALDKSIITFGVSEKSGKIFATSVENTDKIYVFDLPVVPLRKKNIDTLVYKQVDNRFYSVDIPDLLSYAAASPQEEKNKITKHNGLLYNSCYFVSSLKNNAEATFKGSVGIMVASGKNANGGDFSIEEFVEHRDANIKNEFSFYSNTISTSNLNKVIITDSEYESVDPKGVTSNLKIRKWRWKEQDKFVEIDYSSTENFEIYVSNLERTVTSFKLKPHELNEATMTLSLLDSN